MSINETLTVAERLELVRLAKASGLRRTSAQLQPIERVDRTGRLPLSYAQQRLWFMERMGGLGSTYHLPGHLRLRGALDREALVRALDRMVARHEVLRTTFRVREGEPEQRIGPESTRFSLVEHDAAGEAGEALDRMMEAEFLAPFDLERGPLIRGRLIRLAADDHVLLLAMHHIVADGWSMQVFHDELGALYRAFQGGLPDPLPALPVQYADYAAWQRRWVEERVLEAQAGYWTKTLAGAPELLELPTDHPRPARQDHAGATVEIDLSEALSAGLRALSHRHGTTPFMTVLAAWAVVLGRLSGQEDVVVGTPSANRGRREIEGLIGFFVNTLALRIELGGRPTVSDLLGRVRERALGAQANQDIPFEQVVERVQPARSMAHTPVFQVMFSWQNASEGRVELAGLQLGGAGPALQVPAKFDLSLTVGEAGGRTVASLTYATVLFEGATALRHLGYLRRVLEAMVADERTPLDRLELLSAAERRVVVEEWNATDAAFPAGACVHALFEARVARAPGAEALSFEGERLTYAELNARANRLAHHLRALGVGPEVPVAVCLARELQTVVALLAVLKAGGVYVPLDPAHPDERLRFVLEDSAPAALLTRAPHAARFAGAGVPVMDLGDGAAWDACPASDPERVGVGPENLAYVIYTSGSTGRPKGVLVQHGSLVSLLSVTHAAFGVGPGDVMPALASSAFDISLFELLHPLVSGAAVRVVAPARVMDPPALVRELADATLLHAVPALMREIAQVERRAPTLGRLRGTFVGGDQVPADLLAEMRAAFPAARTHVLYGPTEATILASAHAVPADGAAAGSPIGRPLGNVRLYVCAPSGDPQPPGAAGELLIGGIGVARGYLGRPALTAERFVPDPFSAVPGARLYRSGDRARWREDASGAAFLEFLGRTDFQVKIRGFRIEPGEIEDALRRSPGVAECVVVAREDAPGEKRLVAYVVGGAEAGSLREHLRRELPEHMVPAAYVRLEALPLTRNGKLDRRALPAPEGDAFATRGYEAPVGETEAALAEIWAELLKVERVGRHDNFFELGGHSLLIVKLTERMRQRGLEAEVGTLFTTPVLAELAAATRRLEEVRI